MLSPGSLKTAADSILALVRLTAEFRRLDDACMFGAAAELEDRAWHIETEADYIAWTVFNDPEYRQVSDELAKRRGVVKCTSSI
jgi:hypothetical protein